MTHRQGVRETARFEWDRKYGKKFRNKRDGERKIVCMGDGLTRLKLLIKNYFTA